MIPGSATTLWLVRSYMKMSVWVGLVMFSAASDPSPLRQGCSSSRRLLPEMLSGNGTLDLVLRSCSKASDPLLAGGSQLVLQVVARYRPSALRRD